MYTVVGRRKWEIGDQDRPFRDAVNWTCGHKHRKLSAAVKCLKNNWYENRVTIRRDDLSPLSSAEHRLKNELLDELFAW